MAKAKKTQANSGEPTAYKDCEGTVIKIHDYVKDGDGNRYYINSHCQAVPADGSDAPAVELERLISDSIVKVMTIEEVLHVKPVEKRRRGGRRKAEPETPAEEVKQEPGEKPSETAEPEPERVCEKKLTPVTETMILSCLPDDVLAAELRRRGYTLCAVRPALIEL